MEINILREFQELIPFARANETLGKCLPRVNHIKTREVIAKEAEE